MLEFNGWSTGSLLPTPVQGLLHPTYGSIIPLVLGVLFTKPEEWKIQKYGECTEFTDWNLVTWPCLIARAAGKGSLSYASKKKGKGGW